VKFIRKYELDHQQSSEGVKKEENSIIKVGKELQKLLEYLKQEVESSYYYNELLDYTNQLVREYYKRTYDIYLSDQLIRSYGLTDIEEIIRKVKNDIIQKHGSIRQYKLAIDMNFINRYFYLRSIERKGKIIKGRYSDRLYEEVYSEKMDTYIKMISKNITKNDYTLLYYKNRNFKLTFRTEIQAIKFMSYTQEITKLLVTYDLHDQL